MTDAELLKALFGDDPFTHVTLTPDIDEPEGTSRTVWTRLGDGTDVTKDVGHLPLIFRTGDPRSAREQVEDRYSHGGGYRALPGFNVLLHGVALIYPGKNSNEDDEIYGAIGRTTLDSGQTVTLFELGFVLIYTPGADDETPATRAIIMMDLSKEGGETCPHCGEHPDRRHDMQFTPQDYGTIANALRTAADTYKGHAVTCWELARDYHAKHLHSGPATGLAEQFERQAAEALEIAERIEDGEGV